MNGTLRTFFAGITICGAISGSFLLGRSLRGHPAPAPVSAGSLASAHSRLFAKAGTSFADSPRPDDKTLPAAPADVFDEALQHIQTDFVLNSPDTQTLTDAMLSHLTAAIKDPATRYYPSRQDALRRSQLLGYYEGIGANFTLTRARQGEISRPVLTVQSIVAGSPAETVGLKTGDKILEVNGRWIIGTLIPDTSSAPLTEPDEKSTAVKGSVPKGITLSAARTLLSMGKDTALKLTVERAGQSKPLMLEVRTARIASAPAEFQWEDKERGIGRIAIRRFNGYTDDFVQEIQAKYGSAIRGLIVDLRQCSGGVQTGSALPEANGLAALKQTLTSLTDGGTAALLETRARKQEPLVIEAKSGKPRYPIVVLVDHGTANLAEVMAAGLRDLDKAKIVGAPTAGDATLLYYAGVSSGALEIASARLLTASGKPLDKGVTPDIAATPETALEQAITLLAKERKPAE